VQLGNAQVGASWSVRLLPGDYYWSVQTIDGAFAGSEFSSVDSFEVLGFTEIAAGLPGVSDGSVAWGDYDSDGDLDVLLTGDTGSEFVSRVYRTDSSGVFTDIACGLPGVEASSAAWGDYDNDNDLDILLTGLADTGRVSSVYRNDGSGVFTDITVGLPGVEHSSAAWGDYDNDGDLDILLTGWTATDVISRVYSNDGAGVFSDIVAGLPGVSRGSVAWGDYDNDGDLDILLTGSSNSGFISRVYRNDSLNVFTDIAAPLPGVWWSSAAWGDYDNDADLDILLTGTTSSGYITRVYRNDGGDSFIGTYDRMPDVGHGSIAWGDQDNDGDLDIMLTGWDGSWKSGVYSNEGSGRFRDIVTGLQDVSNSSVAWGDYDNDGDLDILLTGWTGSEPVSRVYRNDRASANTPPAAPGGLAAEMTEDQLILSWNTSTDIETPSLGLSYNVRVGTTPGGCEILSAMADTGNGYRRVVQMGNAQQRTSLSLSVVPADYYWSVQAIDGAYAGSPFAPEELVYQTGVGELNTERRLVPCALYPNAPNPFTPSTRITYDLSATGRVRLMIFDVTGRCVRALEDVERPAGQHEVMWNGRDDEGVPVGAGVYFCRLQAGSLSTTTRMVLLK
jgi:predicted nucleotidyltransferase